MSHTPVLLTLLLLVACTDHQYDNNLGINNSPGKLPWYENVSAIPVPQGYERVKAAHGSFTEWLRTLHLRKNNLVHLYDGTLKKNQSAQFAVLDIPVGKKDLQQCADAVMRLRAEYLYQQKRYPEIEFIDNAGKPYKWTKQEDRQGFEKYLENVFGYCNSASLEKQLKLVNMEDIQPGDVFIKGGFPGHAMLVTDVAINDKGKKIFMLLQSYMPAQDIHIVKNPLDADQSPWYEVNNDLEIITPQWIFTRNQLRRW